MPGPGKAGLGTLISHMNWIASTPPKKKKRIAAARSSNRSDHVFAEQESRLDSVLLEQGPQVLQEQPHCAEEPLDDDLRLRERSERLVKEPHHSRLGWGEVPRIPFFVKIWRESGKIINGGSIETDLRAVKFQRGTPASEK